MTDEWPPPVLQLRVVEGSDTVVPLERKRRIRLPRLPRRLPHAPDVRWTLVARTVGLFALVFVSLLAFAGGLSTALAWL